MKVAKKLILLLVTISMIFGIVSTADAGPFRGNRMNHGLRPELAGLKTFLGLNLSDAQRHQMMDLIKKYENERINLRDRIMAARKDLFSTLDGTEFNEENVRKAFSKASSIREELFVSRARMMTELKAVLTPEQLEVLNESKAQRMIRMRKCFSPWFENQSK